MNEQDRMKEKMNQEFLENRRLQKAKRERKRRIRTIVLIGLVLLVTFCAYLVTSNQFVRGLLYEDLNRKSAVNIPVDGSFVTQHEVFDGHVLACSKNGVSAYSMNGEADWLTHLSNLSTQLISFQAPVLRTEKNDAMVYDKGGKTIVKFNRRSITAQITTDYNILFARLFENGFVAAVTEDAGSREQVALYDKAGKEIFIWHSGENNVLDAALSPDGTTLVISSLDISQGKLINNLSFFKVTEPEPYAGAAKENMLLTNLKFYNGNKNLLAVSDSGIFYFNLQGESIGGYNFGGRELSAFQCLEDGMLALVFNSNYENKYRIIILTEKGQEKGVFLSERPIENISFDGKNILANVTKGFHVVSLSGKELRYQPLDKDVKQVLSGDEGHIVLIGTSEIDIVH